MSKDCKCGSTKPYRRAYGCRKCWEAVGGLDLQEMLEERSKGQGSLRLVKRRDRRGGRRL